MSKDYDFTKIELKILGATIPNAGAISYVVKPPSVSCVRGNKVYLNNGGSFEVVAEELQKLILEVGGKNKLKGAVITNIEAIINEPPPSLTPKTPVK